MLIPALLGLVGFLVYYKKNQAKTAGSGKPEKAAKAKAGKTKPMKVKAAKPERGKKADAENPAPVSPRTQRQTANAGGRMGSVL